MRVYVCTCVRVCVCVCVWAEDGSCGCLLYLGSCLEIKKPKPMSHALPLAQVGRDPSIKPPLAAAESWAWPRPQGSGVSLLLNKTGIRPNV